MKKAGLKGGILGRDDKKISDKLLEKAGFPKGSK
jgi:hypothetical protein